MPDSHDVHPARDLAHAAGQTANDISIYLPADDVMCEYVAKRGWTIVAQITEVGSGAAQRELREALLAVARRREVDVVLVWRLDRWGRSVADLVSTFARVATPWRGFWIVDRRTCSSAQAGFSGPVPGTDDGYERRDAGPRLGIHLDFIDDAAIAKLGIPYPLLILPNVKRMPFATLRRIEAYTAKVGIVIVTKRLPSLARFAGRADTIEIVNREGIRAHMLPTTQRWERLLRRGIQQSDSTTKLDDADVYFVANTSNHPVHSGSSPKNLGGRVVDSFTGRATTATFVDPSYDFAPNESRVLVLSYEPCKARDRGLAGSAARCQFIRLPPSHQGG